MTRKKTCAALLSALALTGLCPAAANADEYELSLKATQTVYKYLQIANRYWGEAPADCIASGIYTPARDPEPGERAWAWPDPEDGCTIWLNAAALKGNAKKSKRTDVERLCRSVVRAYGHLLGRDDADSSPGADSPPPPDARSRAPAAPCRCSSG
jgi:hypothetical protein